MAAIQTGWVFDMEAVPIPRPLTDLELMQLIQDGRAIFSTRNSRYASRIAPMEMPIILRSDPMDDVEAMTERLRKDFPLECQAITTPIHNIYEYFDHYDVSIHGTGIIHAVLTNIAVQNVNMALYQARRPALLQDFVKKWIDRNYESFMSRKFEVGPPFTSDEKDQHGEDFLQDALHHISLMRGQIPPHESENRQGMMNSS